MQRDIYLIPKNEIDVLKSMCFGPVDAIQKIMEDMLAQLKATNFFSDFEQGETKIDYNITANGKALKYKTCIMHGWLLGWY